MFSIMLFRKPRKRAVVNQPLRFKSIKDLYIFPPKPISPEDEEAERKRKEVEEVNKAKQIANRIQKARLAKQQQQPITEPDDNVMGMQYKIPIQPKNPRSLIVSLLGAPNAGKSTLTNRIIGNKISAVSQKASTTRTNRLGITTVDNIQLCFYDTPGLEKKTRGRVDDAWEVVYESDIAVFVLDAVKTVGDLETEIINKIRELKKEGADDLPPFCLLLNKVDLWELIPEKDRYPIMDRLMMKIPDYQQLFEQVHQVSAKNGTGIKNFEKYLLDKAKPQPWMYSGETTTDQSPLELCEELVREKIFKHMNQEIPYIVIIDTIGWTEMKDGSLRIDQYLIVRRKSQVKLLKGKGGKSIQSIKEEAMYDMQVAFNRPVILSFEIKVRDVSQQEYEDS